MDLSYNQNAHFTKWVVSAGLLTEPFVLIDVGVQGGESIRWNFLRDHIIVHGFDPIEEVIEELAKANRGHPNRHYHCMALGNTDGDGTFYFDPITPTSSSMVLGPRSSVDQRIVPVRRLDTLLAERIIPTADFIKIDVEGLEKDVLLGAHTLFAGVLGLEVETNFRVSASYQKSHFATIAQIVLKNHLVVFDLAFNRMPRTSFEDALLAKGITREQSLVGRPATVEALFSRDLVEEVNHPESYESPCSPVSINQLIKSMIICELYALNDIALDTAKRFAETLQKRLDVDRAVRLLADPDCNTSQRQIEAEIHAQKRMYEKSTSWRMTAPLRWARVFLFGNRGP
jgi:FkbM family methyltransferase